MILGVYVVKCKKALQYHKSTSKVAADTHVETRLGTEDFLPSTLVVANEN